MPKGINLASKFSTRVDEAFKRKSYSQVACNQDYDFKGVDTVEIYSFPTVALGDYAASGMSRYGTPADVVRQIQTAKIKMDRSWTSIIDQGDKIQSMMLTDAGRMLANENEQVIIPEYDKYIFHTIAKYAYDAGQTDATAIVKTRGSTNAYEEFLKAQESLGNAYVPEEGRVCICSYAFSSAMSLDDRFVRNGDKSQDMLARGEFGMVDGVRLIRVPASLLPTGTDFILTHPVVCCAPKQLSDFKVHDNPPGINGWLLEGRVIYDAFILSQKKAGCFYHGAAITDTAATAVGSSIVHDSSAIVTR